MNDFKNKNAEQYDTDLLSSTGVQNLTALGNLIAWQKVEYDFDFHKTDFPANVTVLVLSEGKSLLPVSIYLFWRVGVIVVHV